jgi:O-antigen/teichoic acid export membrane protein
MTGEPRRGRPRALAGRVVRAGLWVTAARVATYLFVALRVMILARLLSPRDFGAVAIAALPLSVFESSGSAPSSAAALIQRQERPRALLDTAWTLGLARRAVFVLGLVLAAFFAAPETATMIRAMALIPLLQGLRNIGVIEFRQELRLGQDTLLEAAGRFVDAAVAIGLALAFGNAWALVIGAVAAEMVSSLLTYLRHPYRPALRLDPGEVRYLFRYGRWVLGSRAIALTLLNGVQALVGRWFGVAALGQYQMARRVALLSTSQLPQMTSDVTLAAFAKLRADPVRIRGAYLRVLAMTALVTAPVATFLILHAVPLVRVVLGEQWPDVPVVLSILAVQGLFRSATTTTTPLFQGLGRPELPMWIAGSQLAAAALAIVLLLGHGIAGIAAAVAMGSAVSMLVALTAAARALGLNAVDFVRALGPPALACLAMVVVRAVTPPAPDTALGLLITLLVSGTLFVGVLVSLTRLGAYTPDPDLRALVARWFSRAAR